jgi:hypothetical protein
VLGLGLGAGIGNYRSLSREIVLMSGINGRCLIAWMPVASCSWVGLRHFFFHGILGWAMAHSTHPIAPHRLNINDLKANNKDNV